MPQFRLLPNGQLVPTDGGADEDPGEMISEPQGDMEPEAPEEEDELSELERSDVDDVLSGEPTEDEEDDDTLSELERTDIDDILSVSEPKEQAQRMPKRRRQTFRRTTRPYFPPAGGIQGIQ